MKKSRVEEKERGFKNSLSLPLSLSLLKEPNQRASPIAWISSFTNVRQAADSEMSVFLQEKDSRLKFFFSRGRERVSFFFLSLLSLSKTKYKETHTSAAIVMTNPTDSAQKP